MVNLNHAEQPAGGEWLTVKQASQRLRVSAACIYQLTASNKLAHIRVGVGRGTIRISETALTDYVKKAAQKKKSAPQRKSSGRTEFRHLDTNRLREAWGESVS